MELVELGHGKRDKFFKIRAPVFSEQKQPAFMAPSRGFDSKRCWFCRAQLSSSQPVPAARGRLRSGCSRRDPPGCSAGIPRGAVRPGRQSGLLSGCLSVRPCPCPRGCAVPQPPRGSPLVHPPPRARWQSALGTR